ncbi:hypothetical protein BASA81_008840 [Batrachochytrium salamandrivorans]|nr:hypothetical protein BASA81_008840 [Batrachochytrium salamandrivorans]
MAATAGVMNAHRPVIPTRWLFWAFAALVYTLLMFYALPTSSYFSPHLSSQVIVDGTESSRASFATKPPTRLFVPTTSSPTSTLSPTSLSPTSLSPTSLSPTSLSPTSKPTSQSSKLPTSQPSKLPTAQSTSRPIPPPTVQFTFRPTSPPMTPPFVSDVTCVPRICRKRERFEPHTNFTLLASFPGCGNTWTRTIIESGALLWTGSMYADRELFANGFEGEMLDPFADDYSMHSVIKSHQPFIKGPIDPKITAVILVVRSPFDSFLAEFTRIFGKGASHRSKVSTNFLFTNYTSYFSNNIKSWHSFTKFWVDPMMVPNHTHASINTNRTVINTQFQVTSFEYIHSGLIRKRHIPVLVMFYEDFIRHYLAASHRMFEFLKHRLGETMPTSAIEAVVCSITKGKKKQVKEKREHKENKYDVYTNSSSDVVKLGLVRKACEQWKPYWFGDVWGECLKATTSQLTRLPISRVDVDRLQKITKYCDAPPRSDYLFEDDQ